MAFYQVVSHLKIFSTLALACFLVCCANPPTPVAKSDYAKNLIGTWQGEVDNLRETMTLSGDGSFLCRLTPTGFINVMIFPAKSGQISGTWQNNGSRLTLQITGQKNEQFSNRMASSTIVTFTTNQLVLNADRGGVSSFRRIPAL